MERKRNASDAVPGFLFHRIASCELEIGYQGVSLW